MKKFCILFALVIASLFCLSSCSKKYSEDDFIGLTSKQIVEKYGDFDRKQGSPNDEGLYSDCACGYLISEAEKGFFGTTPPEYFMIYFDANGIAHYCVYEQIV